MNIKLTKEEFELLVSGQFVAQDLLAKVQAATFGGRHYAADLSEDDADLIREACCEELQRSGFDGQYEPTKRGLLLEGLIDKFFTG